MSSSSSNNIVPNRLKLVKCREPIQSLPDAVVYQRLIAAFRSELFNFLRRSTALDCGSDLTIANQKLCQYDTTFIADTVAEWASLPSREAYLTVPEFKLGAPMMPGWEVILFLAIRADSTSQSLSDHCRKRRRDILMGDSNVDTGKTRNCRRHWLRHPVFESRRRR